MGPRFCVALCSFVKERGNGERNDNRLESKELTFGVTPRPVTAGVLLHESCQLADDQPAGYTYLANSPLMSQIAFQQSSTVRMTTAKQFDYLNRLQSISSAPAGACQLPLSFGYQYNDANQRTRVNLHDGSFWEELMSVVNTSTSVWQNVSVTTSGGGSSSGNVFVPMTPEVYLYDSDVKGSVPAIVEVCLTLLSARDIFRACRANCDSNMPGPSIT